MTLTMKLPTEYVQALGRRHRGRELPPERVVELIERMEMFYKQWQAAQKRLQKLDEFWDKENVEGHFKQPKWYNAHARLKRYSKEVLDNHRSMFFVLLEADGNHESFDPFYCIGAEDIYADFNSKYCQH